jgi:hypothetical protein
MPFCEVFDVAFAPSGAIVFTAGSYSGGTAAGAVLTTRRTPEATTLHVLAGCSGSSCRVTGGTGPLATSLSDMPALDVRRDGAVVVADTYNHRVLELSADGSRLVVVAGTGRSCSAAGTCPTEATAAATAPLLTDLDLPREVSVAADGTLLLAEEACAGVDGTWLRRID